MLKDPLFKPVDFVYRRSLGVRREMMVTGIQRLNPSHADIHGTPPLVVTLQYPQDREEVISRLDLLKGSNIKVKHLIYKNS